MVFVRDFDFQYEILSELYKFYLWLRCENIIDNDRNWPNVQIVIKLRKKLSVIWCYAGSTSLAPLPTRLRCNIRFRTFIIEFAGEIIVWDIVLQLTDHLPNDPQKNYMYILLSQRNQNLRSEYSMGQTIILNLYLFILLIEHLK